MPVPPMKTLNVQLGARSYPIYIGSGLLDRSDSIRPHIPGRQVLIVSNDTVAHWYRDRLEQALHGLEVDVALIPDGEAHKTLETCNGIFGALLERRFDRTCTLVALGGGVIGDIAGFAAACYQRGVHFVQVPTTLLAQVDSSVGGKTGVNHPLGKNMIGAFHQPLCVVADTDTLSTLPDRELKAGLAEVIKYGLIRDPEFFSWLEEHLDSLLARDNEALAFAIERSCRNKADVVAEDERERGVRALLNLGHTFGHAIEAGCGFGTWLHGEAVAAGTMMAADLSVRLGWLADAERHRAGQIFSRAGLPVHPPKDMSPDAFRRHMSVDKKARDGRLHLVLLRGIGEAVLSGDVPSSHLDATLRATIAAA